MILGYAPIEVSSLSMDLVDLMKIVQLLGWGQFLAYVELELGVSPQVLKC